MRRAVFRISRRSSGLAVINGKPLVTTDLTTNDLLLRACETHDSKVQGKSHLILKFYFLFFNI